MKEFSTYTNDENGNAIFNGNRFTEDLADLQSCLSGFAIISTEKAPDDIKGMTVKDGELVNQ